VIDDLGTLRNIPDARDGLRLVDRRLLFVMNEMGVLPDRPCRRSDFELRYPLIEGNGNFGTIHGNPAADSNCTEADHTLVGLSQ